MPLNIFVVGASRGVGYFAALRFLAKGANVTFLSRSTHIFEEDAELTQYVKADKAHIVKGDALVEEDVERGWTECLKYGPIDGLVFSVGTTSQAFHPLKGLVLSIPNLVTQCLFRVLCTMPDAVRTSNIRIVLVSSTGVTNSSYVPFLLRAYYSYLLKGPFGPHTDKLGAERLMAWVAGWEWDPIADGKEPGEALMGPGDWRERKGLPAKGSLKDKVLVLRPVAFTHGECQGDLVKDGKQPYTASTGEVYGYTISRRDVGHCIVDAISNRWEEYGGKRISLSY